MNAKYQYVYGKSTKTKLRIGVPITTFVKSFLLLEEKRHNKQSIEIMHLTEHPQASRNHFWN